METELESMVVRLLGDGSSYQNMMKEAQETAVEASDTFKTVAESVVLTLGGLGLGSWLNEAFHAWSEAEDVGISLRATLRANERDVDSLAARYQRFASQMQLTTTISDEATMTNLRMAESFNLTGSAAEKAVTDAIGLARSANSSAQSMIRLTAAMEQGDIKRAMMFSRMVPQLRGIKDEQEFTARYSRLVASGFEAITESANTGAGMVRAFTEAYGDLMEEFGNQVAELLKPILEVKIEIVRWFQALDEGTKQTIVGIAAVVVAVLSVAAAIKIAGLIFNTLFGGIGIWLGVFTTAAVGVVLLTQSLGGVKVVWEAIKEKAAAFWAWLVPIGRAALGALSAAWDIAFGFASAVWDTVKENALAFWSWLTGQSSISAKDIQDYLIDAFIKAEYVLRNFGAVFSWVWAGAKLKLTEFHEIMGWFFGPVIRNYLNNFGTIWTTAWGNMFKFVQDNWQLMIRGSLGDPIAAAQIAVGAFRAAMSAVADVPLPPRISSALENQLREEFNGMGNALWGEVYDAFRARRLNEIFGESIEVAEEAGEATGAAFRDGSKKEMEKFDAVAMHSAEALSRIAAYQERISENRQTREDARRVASGSNSQALASSGVEAGIRTTNQLMRQVADNTARIASTPPIEVEGADL